MFRFFTTFATILTLSLLVNYLLLLNQKKVQAENNAKKIETILTENFERIEEVLISIGQKIANDTETLDLKIIHKIFVQASALHGSNNIFSWSLFDWTNSDGYQTVSTMLGIRGKDSPEMSDRYYASLKGSNPWTLLLSKPALGNPSGVFVIPIGVQIETKKAHRAGTVTAGINIQELTNIIEYRLNGDSPFALIDVRSDDLVLSSKEISKKSDEKIDKADYISSRRMIHKFPYEIFVGYDKRQFWREVFDSSLLLFVQIVSVISGIIFLRKF